SPATERGFGCDSGAWVAIDSSLPRCTGSSITRGRRILRRRCVQYVSAMSLRRVLQSADVVRLALAVFVVSVSACAANPAPSARGESFDLVVAATTDVHGRLTGWDYYAGAPDTTRGLSRAATIVDSVRGANPGRVVLIDAGDMLEGNPLTL